MVMFLILLSSCTEDFTNPKVLSGTVWRCTTFTDSNMATEFDYVELKFISTSEVEGWNKPKNGTPTKPGATATYSIKDKTITITTGTETLTGIIDNKSIILTEGEVSLTFIKL